MSRFTLNPFRYTEYFIEGIESEASVRPISCGQNIR